MAYYGGSCIVGPDGKDIARALHSAETLVGRLDATEVKTARKTFAVSCGPAETAKHVNSVDSR